MNKYYEAAPELLEALRDMCALVRNLEANGAKLYPAGEERIEAAVAAIAKATQPQGDVPRFKVFRPDGSLYADCDNMASAEHFAGDDYRIEAPASQPNGPEGGSVAPIVGGEDWKALYESSERMREITRQEALAWKDKAEAPAPAAKDAKVAALVAAAEDVLLVPDTARRAALRAALAALAGGSQ